MAAVALGGLAATVGCDQGSQSDQPQGAGGTIHVVGQFPPSGQSLPANSHIEFAFDRYLLPVTVTRQSFVLHPAGSGGITPPIVSYDPVARIVTLTPAPDGQLMPDQTYTVDIDRTQLRAIDGAQLDPGQTTSFSFQVVAGDGGTAYVPPAVDYCADISPLWKKCTVCHTVGGLYAGLDLSTLQNIAATAIGTAAHDVNMGPGPTAQSAGPVFGYNMPIIDPGLAGHGGDPANSWLMYKVLIATPQATATTTYSCDGGKYTPTDVSKAHLTTTNAASDGERANLINQVPGREMPYPLSGDALANPAVNSQTLSVDELERLSLWIASADGGADAAASLLPAAACPCN